MILFRQFFPVFIFVMVWLLVVLVRNTIILDFLPLSPEAILYLSLFFLVSILGYIAGSLAVLSSNRGIENQYGFRSVNVKANWLIFFAILSIFFAIAKFYSSLGLSVFSLEELARYRQLRARDEGDVKGGSVFGVISTITFSFVIVVCVYGIYFKKYLSRFKLALMGFVFFAGIAVTFLGGGRFSAAISVLFVFLFSLCQYIRQAGGLGRLRSRLNWGRKVFYVFPLLILFSYMFVVRFAADGRDEGAIFTYLNSGLPGVSVPSGVESYLGDSRFLVLVYFVVSMFMYYIGHSFYQFDVLLQYESLVSAPYALAYQFYPFVLFFNKLGAGVISIESILNELPNAGTYFSLAGAFYLDFGYWGAMFSVFLVFLVGAFVWGRMLSKGGFLSLYFSSMFMVLVVFSPIVGVVATAVYPSLIAVSLVLWVFMPARSR